jgi:D-alanyl-lipoteichoic acid acyltransferase DltB (MBOAT superfamily)
VYDPSGFGKSNINILMLGVCYKNVAFPLMFTMLDKRGNSNCNERIDLINKYIDWFGKDCIDSIVGDREFVGVSWIKFLNFQSIRYVLRFRNNLKVFLCNQQKEINVGFLFDNLNQH